MTDLTAITTPFGLLDGETQEALKRLRANEAKQLTSARIAMQHKNRWPAIAGWGALLALLMLGGTGWL